MKKIKNIMVGLDFTTFDEKLVQYTAFLCQILDVQKIYFINVQKSLRIPADFQHQYPTFSQPVDDRLESEMRDLVEANFPEDRLDNISYLVKQGSETTELLTWSEVKHIDLLILGRKPLESGSGNFAKRMARKATCSILFVPENAHLRLNSIFIANDFSSNAAAGFLFAKGLWEKDVNTKVYSENIYSIPKGYFLTRTMMNDFTQSIIEGLRDKQEKFESTYRLSNMPIRTIFQEDRWDGKLEKTLYEDAMKLNVDMLVLGAKGTSMIAPIFLGSVSDRMLNVADEVPLLLVKDSVESGRYSSVITLPEHMVI